MVRPTGARANSLPIGRQPHDGGTGVAQACVAAAAVRGLTWPPINTKTGEVLGKTAARHTSAEFVAFLTDIVANQPRGKEIHVIADNRSAHKSQRSKPFSRRIKRFT
jgi:hypothetical protein